MNFEESILSLKEQLNHNFKVENKKNFKDIESFILIGMGGSALSGGVIKSFNSAIPLLIHKSYDLPYIKNPKKTLIIFSSYSGNTEEVLDSIKKAKKRKLNFLIIAKGGSLIEIAKREKVSYIQIPDKNLQPRMALGFSVNALFTILEEKKGLKELKNISNKINFNSLKKEGIVLCKNIKNLVPLIYSSNKNIDLAYNLKIKFNENAKAPAFCNEIPESNHNEISGFNKTTLKFANNFILIFLNDNTDHIRIKKRIEITKNIYKKEGFKILTINLKGNNFLEKYFTMGVLIDYTTMFLAQNYGFDPIEVPTIENLKKQLK